MPIHSFPLMTQESVKITTDAHLRRVKGAYEVHFLGKNGEPIEKQETEVTLRHRVRGTMSSNLRTDKQGIIYLGALPDVHSIRVEANKIGARAEWQLDLPATSNSSDWTYPGQIELLEDESVELPIMMPSENLERKWVSLIRRNNGVIIENWFDRVTLNKRGDEHTGYHTISV